MDMASSRYGEGTVYFDATADLWVGQVYFGPGNRPKVRARRRADMLVKLRGLLADKDAGVGHAKGSTGDWLEYWLSQVKRTVELSTWEDYSRWSRLYLEPHVGTIPLRSLSEDDVEEMMSALEAQGLSAKTIRLARTLLIQALDVALRRDKVRKNVASLTKPPKLSGVKISDRLSAEEAKAVLKALLYDRYYALALLVLSTGMRPGECFALRWSDINFRQASLRIGRAKTPAGVRSIPLTADLVAALGEHQVNQKAEKGWTREGYVFLDEAGEPLKHRNVTAWWHDALKRAGVERRRFYATRHTAATLMLNNGVPLEVISKTLGHASLAITSDVYASVEENLQRDAAAVMGSVLKL